MSRILVTGGTGHVGRALRQRLAENDFTVRIASQRPARENESSDVEWAIIDLKEIDSLHAAAQDVDIIVHTASDATNHKEIDIQGTARLLDAAQEAGVGHFIYVSIIGVDKIQYGYYQSKFAAEQLVIDSGVPYSILRAAQFHWFADFLFKTLVRPPISLFPMDLRLQTIAHEEAAAHLALAAANGPMGRLPDLAGPEVLTSRQMIDMWLAAQGKRQPLIKLSAIPGSLRKGWREGWSTSDAQTGNITWADYLAVKYGQVSLNKDVVQQHHTENSLSTN